MSQSTYSRRWNAWIKSEEGKKEIKAYAKIYKSKENKGKRKRENNKKFNELWKIAPRFHSRCLSIFLSYCIIAIGIKCYSII